MGQASIYVPARHRDERLRERLRSHMPGEGSKMETNKTTPAIAWASFSTIFPLRPYVSMHQRGLNYLKRARLPWGRMVRSTPTHPLAPLSRLGCLSFSPFLCVASRAYTDGRGGRRGWAWSRIIQPQESLALYKSFITLCYAPGRLPVNTLYFSTRLSSVVLTTIHPPTMMISSSLKSQ
jgi:hypothetical protein